jgi:hypothetical protein
MISIRKKLPIVKEYRNEQGYLHREDGPAIEFANGTKAWYLNGERHREDGPACEWKSGHKEWYLNGEAYSEQDWQQELVKIKLKRILEL